MSKYHYTATSTLGSVRRGGVVPPPWGISGLGGLPDLPFGPVTHLHNRSWSAYTSTCCRHFGGFGGITLFSVTSRPGYKETRDPPKNGDGGSPDPLIDCWIFCMMHQIQILHISLFRQMIPRLAHVNCRNCGSYSGPLFRQINILSE